MNDTPRYFDREGRPLKLLVWARMFEDWDYRLIAQTNIARFKISTVWIGLNQSHHPGAAPLIFETMVFENGDSIDCRRYATEAKAIEGHAMVRHAIEKITSENPAAFGLIQQEEPSNPTP